MTKIDSKIPEGQLAEKWSNYKAHQKLVNPANKRRLDIIVVLCMVMMFCMFLWSVFRFSMISYSAILEFFSNSSSEHCKYMQFWGIGKDRMNIFGEAINAFLSGLFRYSPGFSRY